MWIGFAIGLVVGICLSLVVIALCRCSAMSEEEQEMIMDEEIRRRDARR